LNIGGRSAVDVDVHPHVPDLKTLFPYLDDYWRDMAETRGIDGYQTRVYPPGAAITCRPDWRGPDGRPGGDLGAFRRQLFDGWGERAAICNCLYGVQMINDENLGAVFAKAVNDWMAAEWLDREPRLRASIVIPLQSPELAVDEIERLAPDRRFVSVLLLANADMPLGKRYYWPIYAAAERHGLPVTIHPGGLYRHAPTGLGWPSYHVEGYVGQATTMQAQLASLISHGVFVKYPGLKLVLLESGVTWAPSFLWRFGKFWRGLRIEIPWIDRPPIEIMRECVRFSLQPFDAPPTADGVERIVEHIGSEDVLLFSSDYPHWHFEGSDAIPEGISGRLLEKLLVANAMTTYTRLGDAA
jgi:uncharacterized protein